jgi:hypothetical protein
MNWSYLSSHFEMKAFTYYSFTIPEILLAAIFNLFSFRRFSKVA